MDMIVDTDETDEYWTGHSDTACLHSSVEPLKLIIKGYGLLTDKVFKIADIKFVRDSRLLYECYRISGPQERIKVSKISCPPPDSG